jgi:hypothetical protein
MVASAAVACTAAAQPQKLAESVSDALNNADLTAVSELAQLSGAPAAVRSMLYDSAIECSEPPGCMVSLAPVDADFKERAQYLSQSQGLEIPDVVGLLVIASSAEGGSGSSSTKVPYAEVDGEYRVVAGRLSAEKIESLRATTNESLLEKGFSWKVQDPETGEGTSDWATAATRLEEDGGAAGRGLVADTSAMYQATQAKDPDRAAQLGDRLLNMVLNEPDGEGNPRSKARRQLQLEVWALSRLHDVRIHAGYQLGSSVLLMIEARDGIDWIVRGPVLMIPDGDSWGIAANGTIRYPAGS